MNVTVTHDKFSSALVKLRGYVRYDVGKTMQSPERAEVAVCSCNIRGIRSLSLPIQLKPEGISKRVRCLGCG